MDTFPDAFHETLSHDYAYTPSFKAVFSKIQAIQHQMLITRSIETGQGSHLLDVIARFQTTSSTDLRDKAFALLALSSNPLGIKPDYSATKRTVFTKFATAYINHVENLDILCQNRWGFYTDEGDVTNGIPSWVPDFEQRDPVRLIFAQRGIFNAGRLKCKVPCYVTDGDRLIVEGVNLGEMGKVYRVMFWGPDAEWIPDEIIASETLMYAPSILSKAENAPQAFWRTLLSDCVRDPKRRLNEDGIAAYGFFLTRGNGETFQQLNCHIQFATTKNGLYCLATDNVLDGDFVVVLNGGKVPAVLRKRTGNSEGSKDKCEYILVGPAYVHGFMDGEAMTLADEGRLQKEEFVLA
ncbi:hypothetical protein EAF04_000867 [Stromatinia cepivora]|nr:hypothetical protein EAF04_000867 [Stromatinia cepivora]